MAPSRSRISDLLRSKFGGSKTRRRRRRKADPQTSGEHLEERTLLSATYKDDSIIVRANPGVTAEQLEGQVQDVSVRALGNYGLFHVVLPVGADVHDSIESYEASSLVQYAQTNNTNFTPSAEPNDPQFPDQYHLNNTGQTAGTVDADIDATEAWDTNTSAENIIIAIIDSGTDLDHEDLADNIWVNEGEIPGDGIDNDNNGYIDDVNGWDFVNQTNDPNGDGSSGWHGTHVAGIAGAVGNNGIGVSGVAWNVQLMPLRIFAPGTSTAAIVEAINYSVENGAQVSNNSWGGYGFDGAIFDAISNARDNDQLFVASAGNDGFDVDIIEHYPSGYNLDNIISVGGSTDRDGDSGFNLGATSVDLVAPGTNILSTIGNDAYGFLSGTSMSGPVVAGAAAILREADPTAGFAEIKQQILDSVDQIPTFAGRTLTGGRLNLNQALAPFRISVFQDSFPEDAGAGAATGIVSRVGDTTNALTVNLSSSDVSEATVSGTVTIPAGRRSAFFTVNAVDDALLDGPQTVEISVSFNGVVADSDFVNVLDVETLTLEITEDSILESGGSGAATGVITRSNTDTDSPSILVSTANEVLEYDTDGNLISSFPIEYPGASRPSGEDARDLVVNANGDIVVYNGVNGAPLSRFNGFNWVHESIAGFGTDAAFPSSGGIAAFGNLIFATDMNTSGGEQSGLVRFNPGSGQVLRLGQTIPGDRVFATVVSGTHNTIVELDPETGVVLNSFAAPDPSGDRDGLAYDGNTLWYLGSGEGDDADNLFRLDADNGSIIDGGSHDIGLPGTTFNGLAVLNGQIYLTDANNRIVVYDPALRIVNRIMDIAGPNAIDIGGGLTAAVNPDKLYVTDSSGARVHELDPDTGLLTGTFTHNAGLDEVGLAAIGDEILIGNASNNTINIHNRDGSFVRTIDVPDTTSLASLGSDGVEGQVANPDEFIDVTVGLDGLLHALDVGGQDVQTFDATSFEFVGELSLDRQVSAISVDSFGSLFGSSGGTIYRFDETGATVDSLVTTATNIIDLDVSAGGTILAGDEFGAVILTDTTFANPPLEFSAGATPAFVAFSSAPGASTGDLIVNLTNSDLTELGVPQSVLLPAGEQSVTFPIDAVDDSILDGTQNVIVTATNPAYANVTGDSVDVLDVEEVVLDISEREINETDGANAATISLTRSNVDGPFDFITTRTIANTDDLTIPDTNIVISQITVPTITAVVSDIDVELSLTHGHLGDLDVFLISPQGTRVELFTDVGANGTRITNLVLDDQAASPITSGSAPFTGRFQPEGSFADFAGEDVSGIWTLEISDDTNLSSGNLLEWSLGLESSGFAPLDVTLVTSDSSEAIPQTTVITIPANQVGIELPLDAIDDALVDGTQSVTISGSAGSYVTGSDSVDVLDVEVLEIAVDSDEFGEDAGANAATGTVTRTSASDLGSPLVVTLDNRDRSEISIPATVTIPAGESSATFDIDAVDDFQLDGRQRVRIDATAPGFAVTNDSRVFVNVLDSEPILQVTISEESVSENSGFVTATLARTNFTTLANSLSVGLTSSLPADVTVPPTITIPAGQESVDFTITLNDNSILDGDRDVVIRAEGGGTFPGDATLQVRDFETLSLSFSPTEFDEADGAEASQVTVTRNNTDIDTAVDVTLVSDDTTELQLPETVRIPAGETSVTFFASAVNDDEFDGPQEVNVGVTSGGYVTQSQVITVLDHEPTTVLGPVGEIAESQPEFTWEPVEGATEYHVRVDNRTTGERSVINFDEIPADATSFTSDLHLGLSNYRVRVRYRDALENWQPWSLPVRFKVRTAPEIVSPVRVATDGDFQWTAVLGAEHYELVVDDLTRGVENVINERNLTNTSFVQDLEPGRYEMSVRAIGPNGIQGQWERVIFSRVTQPTITSPQAGPAWEVLTVTWADEDADHYDIRIHEATGEQTNLNFIRDRFVVGTSFVLNRELEVGNNYIISVRAFSEDGQAGIWSERVVVRIGDNPVIQTPQTGTTTGPNPFFSWNTVLATARYDFRIRELGGNRNLFRDRGVQGTSIQPEITLESGTTYRAWVRSVSIDGQKTRWSPFVEFTVASSDSVNPDQLPIVMVPELAQEGTQSDVEAVAAMPVIVNSYTGELAAEPMRHPEPVAPALEQNDIEIDEVMEQLPEMDADWWAGHDQAADAATMDAEIADGQPNALAAPVGVAGGALLGLLLGGRRKRRDDE